MSQPEPIIHCKFDELIATSSLKAHPLNRNQYPKDQIERLAKILAYQGIRAPIVVSKRSGYINKGHGTLLAIKANKWKKAPIVYQDFDSDEQEYAFVQSDTAIANWAELALAWINADIPDLGPDFDIDPLGLKDLTISQPIGLSHGKSKQGALKTMSQPDIRCKYDEMVDVKTLQHHPKNRNEHPPEQVERLAKILRYQPVRAPIIVSNQSKCIAKGHGLSLAFKKNKWTQVPVVYQDFDSEEQEYAFVQSDNAIALWASLDLSGINEDIPELGPDFDPDLLGIKGFTIDPSERMAGDDIDHIVMADAYLEAPFSVLNARGGRWQERKAAWLSLGIKSEQGRGDAGPAASYKGQDSLNKMMKQKTLGATPPQFKTAPKKDEG